MEILSFICGLALSVSPLHASFSGVSADSTVIYEVYEEDLIVEIPHLCVDSVTPRVYGKFYERDSRSVTTVYSWVNELPQFVYDGKGSVDGETPFARYIRESGVFDDESDVTRNARYTVVIERDGSISYLHRVHGKGDRDFYAKIEKMLGGMPHWKPGSHNGSKVRVLATLYVVHPKASRKPTITFANPYFKNKNEVGASANVGNVKSAPRTTKVKMTNFRLMPQRISKRPLKDAQ